MAGYEEMYVKNGSVNLYVRKYGQGDPLLLVHGAACDCDFFHETAGYLSRFYTVYSYDRRGYHRSSKPEDGDYSMHAQAGDAYAILKEIGSPCFIIAHSAGTMVTMELAASYAPNLRALILHEPPTANLLPEDGKDYTTILKIREAVEEGRYARAASRFLTMMATEDPRARERSEAEMEQGLQNLMQTVSSEVTLFYNYRPVYEKIKKYPVVVGLGEHSLEGEQAIIARKTAEALSCRLVYFPGQHNCAFDLPFEFAAISRGVLSLFEASETQQLEVL